jgi:hypothetical protein
MRAWGARPSGVRGRVGQPDGGSVDGQQRAAQSRADQDHQSNRRQMQRQVDHRDVEWVKELQNEGRYRGDAESSEGRYR